MEQMGSMGRLVVGVLLSVLGLASGQSVGAGRVLEQTGQFERALSEYRLVLEKNPRDLAAYQGFARVCRQLSRFDSLEAVSARLSASVPEESQFALGRMDGLLGLKRKKEALELGRKVIQIWPGQAAALAEVLERWREFGEAVNYMLLARPAKGSDQAYSDRLISLYELQNRYVDAAREIVRVLDYRSDLLKMYLGRIREYSRKTSSAQLLSELGKLKDQAARARAQAEVYFALGKEPEALKAARQGMNREGMYRLARECEESGALNTALAVYKEQDLRPDQARVLRKLGRDAEALALLGQDQNPDAWFELAELSRLRTRDMAAAAKGYEKVLRSRPTDEPAGFGLAYCQTALGQLEQARKTLAQVKPQSDRVLFLTAEVFLYRQDLDSARYFSQELVRRYQESPLANDGLELILLCSGGERASELARAMYESRTGAIQKALERCAVLARGRDDVAEQSWFLRARLLRDSNRPKSAVSVLDSFALAFPLSSRRPKQLMEQADLYLRDLKDENKYRQMLEQVALLFPGSPYAPVARSLLAEANRPTEPGVVR